MLVATTCAVWVLSLGLLATAGATISSAENQPMIEFNYLRKIPVPTQVANFFTVRNTFLPAVLRVWTAETIAIVFNYFHYGVGTIYH